MIFAGIDIGSNTAKSVLLQSNGILTSAIDKVQSTPVQSAWHILNAAKKNVGLSSESISYICSTGYGRFEIPFSQMNMSEISCHGMGAFWLNPSIRTIIDIGGQDCKIIVVNEKGLIEDFKMNDKCAAGTGKSLEILAQAIGVELDKLGSLSLKSKKPVLLTNKCSIFMELEVLEFLIQKRKKKDIAFGINDAVARRLLSMSRFVRIKPELCITGGVSKNHGVVTRLEEYLQMKLTSLSEDPQLAGAIGAAVFASLEYQKSKETGSSL